MDDLLCKPSGSCGQALHLYTQVPDLNNRVHRLLLLRTNRIKGKRLKPKLPTQIKSLESRYLEPRRGPTCLIMGGFCIDKFQQNELSRTHFHVHYWWSQVSRLRGRKLCNSQAEQNGRRSTCNQASPYTTMVCDYPSPS